MRPARNRLVPRFPAIAAAILLFSGCASGGNPSTPSSDSAQTLSNASGTLTFSVSPIDPDAILWITPLGNLNPPGHALPTDHIYFYFAYPADAGSPVAKRTAFLAPGDGTVFDVRIGNGSDWKVFVRASSTLWYYLDHLILDASIERGTKITAGQRLGTTGSAYGIDLGVVNEARTLGFLNPARYSGDTLHADSPLKYYEEPYRSRLYSKVQRLGSDLDGRIDFDVAGTAAGNWFAPDSTPLAFVYDTYDPAKVLISIASGPLSGVFAIAAGDPEPRSVSTASGKVVYTLTRSITGPNSNVGGVVARMLVQMVDETHLREEMFVAPAAAVDFTSSARTFAR